MYFIYMHRVLDSWFQWHQTADLSNSRIRAYLTTTSISSTQRWSDRDRHYMKLAAAVSVFRHTCRSLLGERALRDLTHGSGEFKSHSIWCEHGFLYHIFMWRECPKLWCNVVDLTFWNLDGLEKSTAWICMSLVNLINEIHRANYQG